MTPPRRINRILTDIWPGLRNSAITAADWAEDPVTLALTGANVAVGLLATLFLGH